MTNSELQLVNRSSKEAEEVEEALEADAEVVAEAAEPDKDDSESASVPHLSIRQLFGKFLWFGCRAFGGPIAQIAMMKQALVDEEKWITSKRFNRVLALYQVLPGPEATELACYFGHLARKELGCFLGGLGFLAPGICCLLFLSWLYEEYGLDSKEVRSSMNAINPVVAASIFRATHKLSDHAFFIHETGEFSWLYGGYGLLAFLMTGMGINFFITIAVCGVLNTIHAKQWKYSPHAMIALLLAGVGGYIGFVIAYGRPSEESLGSGVTTQPNPGGLFLLGLLGGLLTFGGAYTAIPFIYADAVLKGGWITDSEFLDALAITMVLPTPLVSFVTFIGYIGDGIVGALMMTIGMFLPCFSFTLLGHRHLEKLIDTPGVQPFLDGVGASVIGLVLATTFQFAETVINDPISVLLFGLALAALFHFKHQYTQVVVILIAAIAGQIMDLSDNTSDFNDNN